MRISWLLFVLAACSGAKVLGPDSGATDSATDTQSPDSDSDSGTADTGWPQVDGEDFAVADAANNALRVYWNEGGAISPTVGTTTTLPYTGGIYFLCDYDGDGLDDLWVANPNNSAFDLEIYTNKGGSWPASSTFSTTVTMNPASYAFACGDFTGDGKADFAAYRKDGTKIYLYENSAGNFDFDAVAKSATGLTATATWQAADVDGDGTDELIGLDKGTLTVFPVSGLTLGTPLFTYAVPEGYKVAFLDLSADGKSDLVLWNGAALIVRPSTGSAFDSASAEAFTVPDSGIPMGGNLR